MKGSNMYGKGNTRNRDYTEMGEGTNMGGEDILVEGRGEIYMIRRVYGTAITQKRAGGHTRRGNTHGEGTHTDTERGHTERGHTRRRDTHGEGTIRKRNLLRREDTYGGGHPNSALQCHLFWLSNPIM